MFECGSSTFLCGGRCFAVGRRLLFSGYGAVGVGLRYLTLFTMFYLPLYTRRICSVTHFNVRPKGGDGVSAHVRGTLTGVEGRMGRNRTMALHFRDKACRFCPRKTTRHACCVSGRSRSGPGEIKLTLRSVGSLAVRKGKTRFVFRKRVVPMSLLEDASYALRGFDVSFTGPRVTRIRVVGGRKRGKVAFRPTP